MCVIVKETVRVCGGKECVTQVDDYIYWGETGWCVCGQQAWIKVII